MEVADSESESDIQCLCSFAFSQQNFSVCCFSFHLHCFCWLACNAGFASLLLVLVTEMASEQFFVINRVSTLDSVPLAVLDLSR